MLFLGGIVVIVEWDELMELNGRILCYELYMCVVFFISGGVLKFNSNFVYDLN